MKNSINNLIIYNGYPLSVVIAVSFHVIVLLSMLYLQVDSKAETLEIVPATIIKSLFIDENPQVVNQRNVERRLVQDLERQKTARETQARQQREAAQSERQAEERAEALAQQQERERQQAALREKAEVERQLTEQKRLDSESEERRQREVTETRRQQELENQRQQQIQAERQRDQQARAEAAAAEAARTEFELIQSATGLIQQLVQENWSRPPSARNGMQTVLRITMLPTGEVTDVTIIQSSNDPAFDRAAESAVFRAAPFRELQSLPIKLFNENFRSLALTFKPEDLLN
ncbi:MAG: colicin import membrane protein [Pseudohongiellaceae bacterium]|jgi:colicin import membrane protein